MTDMAFGVEFVEEAAAPVLAGRWIRYEDGTMYNPQTGVWKIW